MKISVIMPVFNGAQTIEKAISSVLEQSYQNWELIIIDDCSTDSTGDILKAFAAKDKRFVLLKTPENIRSRRAANIGLGAASGEWITFLDADDWYHKERLQKLIEAATALTADVLIDNLFFYDHAIQQIVDRTDFGKSNIPVPLRKEDLFLKDGPYVGPYSLGYSKLFIKSSFLHEKKIRNWGLYRNCEDFLFLADCVLSGGASFIIPEAYYVYQHQSSPTTEKKSPFSHAENVFDSILESSDILSQKYALSPQERGALEQRKKFFQRTRDARAYAARLRNKDNPFLFLGILAHPSFILHALRMKILKHKTSQRIQKFLANNHTLAI